MATTFILKRKYFANNQQGEQKKSGIGKKLAIGAGIAAAGATALAAKNAGGLKNLGTAMKNAGGIKGAATTFGQNVKGGATGVYNQAKNAITKKKPGTPAPTPASTTPALLPAAPTA